MSLRSIFIPLGALGFPSLFLKHIRGYVNGHQSVRHLFASLKSSLSFFIGDHELRIYNPRLRISGVGLPPFHAIGFFLFTLIPIYHGITVSILPPVDTVAGIFPLTPSPDIVLNHVRHTKSTALMTVPAFLHTWARSKDDVSILASLSFVVRHFSNYP